MASNLPVTSLLTFNADMIKDMIKGTDHPSTAIVSVKVVANLFAFKGDPRIFLFIILILNSIWT